MKRSLDEKFLNDFETGILKEVFGMIQKDSTLDLQFRGDYIDIYYRGGRILHLEKKGNDYNASIDVNYLSIMDDSFKSKFLGVVDMEEWHDELDMEEWLDKLPLIKQARDFHYTDVAKTTEREFQQLIIRSNNYDRISNSSDFFITDMEYDFKIPIGKKKSGKIDLIGIEWNANNRGINSLKTKFAFIEVKYGNDAVSGTSGLNEHLEDMKNFLKENQNDFTKLVDDTLKIFKQKRRLQLYQLSGNDNEIVEIAHSKPYFIVVLADYKNRLENLYNLIEAIDIAQFDDFFDLRFSVSSFMGYGLYSNCLLDRDATLEYLTFLQKSAPL